VGEALAAAPADVVVDFTSPGSVKGNVDAALEVGVAVVIGSSGLSASDYDEIDVKARGAEVGVIAAGNFSLLATLLPRSAAESARHVDSWEVLDYTSAGKTEVPSGKSRGHAERMGGEREAHLVRSLCDLPTP